MKRLFTEAPASEAKLYSLEWMATENAAWHALPPDQQQFYGGRGSQAEDGLIVDPRLSLLIGDLGFDRPVALDYSAS